MQDSLKDIYESGHLGVRPRFGSAEEDALRYYARFVEFVVRVAPPGSTTKRLKLLDVGCGSGWSTYALALANYDSTGIDLNPGAFEAPPRLGLHLQVASVLAMPFLQESFDVVVAYQVIEHVPDPERALKEMARVCRAGGIVCIAGPNLMNPLLPIRYLLKPSSWLRMKYRRTPGMPRHTYGNTLWELLGRTVLRSAQLGVKLVNPKPHFTMRVPDMVPPFHSDNDACYLCNPSDLIAWFMANGWRILRRGRHGRPPLTYLVAGGTWVAARKPSSKDD